MRGRILLLQEGANKKIVHRQICQYASVLLIRTAPPSAAMALMRSGRSSRSPLVTYRSIAQALMTFTPMLTS